MPPLASMSLVHGMEGNSLVELELSNGIKWLCRAKFFPEIFGMLWHRLLQDFADFAALMCSCTPLKVLAGAAEGLRCLSVAK